MQIASFTAFHARDNFLPLGILQHSMPLTLNVRGSRSLYFVVRYCSVQSQVIEPAVTHYLLDTPNCQSSIYPFNTILLWRAAPGFSMSYRVYFEMVSGTDLPTYTLRCSFANRACSKSRHWICHDTGHSGQGEHLRKHKWSAAHTKSELDEKKSIEQDSG